VPLEKYLSRFYYMTLISFFLPGFFFVTGLKYEDLLLENDDLEKALNRIPKAVKVNR